MWWTEQREASKKDEQDFLAEEALKHESEDDFVTALESQGKMQYHGSPNQFDQFSYDYLGTQGTGEGKGFYFTNKKEIAQGYMGQEGNGKLFEAYINVKKPLSLTTRTISIKDLAKFIKRLDPDGTDFLSNYGDVTWDGYNKVLNEAVRMVYSTSDNDVDIVCDIANSLGGNPEQIYPILEETLGYDGIIVPNSAWGDGQTITVAFNNDQILTREKLAEYYRSLRQQK